jgi:hypothetical protein
MSTLLIIHGDEGNEGEVHGVILLDQTFNDEQLEEKFDEIKDEISEDWVGDYSQEILNQILVKHGLSGISVPVTIGKKSPNPNKMYYSECFC